MLCTGLCTPPDSLYKDQLSSSTVDVLPDPIPDLYNVLTEEEDPEQRWQVFSYPAHLDLLYFKPQQSQNEVVLDGGDWSKAMLPSCDGIGRI